MKLQSTFLLLLLLAVVAFAGCYTQLGYHASSNFEHGQHYRSVRDAGAEHTSETESEETEHAHDTETESEGIEREHEDAEESEGYYGRRKRTSRTVYVYPDRYDTLLDTLCIRISILFLLPLPPILRISVLLRIPRAVLPLL